MSEFIDNFVAEITNSGLSSWWNIRGCWEFEIRDLERHFDIELPQLYRDFLKKMGRSAGKFMQGTDMFYRHLYDNRGAMEEVLELDKQPFSLSKEMFVFSSHQGYIFFFFDTAQNLDDPAVYGYREGELEFRLANGTFSAFLLAVLEEQKGGYQRK